MEMTAELIEKIKSIIEERDLDLLYCEIGVRVQEEPFELGEIDHISHVWVDGDDTGEELNGICATKIDCLGKDYYFGAHAAIICGNRAEMGEDLGELIIKDAIVEAIIC